MTHYETIKQVVTASTIPDTDKAIIIDTFATVSDDSLEEIASLFTKKPEWVSIFNENRKKKQAAYASGDPSAWNEILEEEKKYMNDLMYDLD
jgi:hypothetical protein